MKRDGSVAHEQINEFGDELLGVLMGPIHVVSPGDDKRQVERTRVGLGDELGAGLGGRVGVGGLEGGGEEERVVGRERKEAKA